MTIYLDHETAKMERREAISYRLGILVGTAMGFCAGILFAYYYL